MDQSEAVANFVAIAHCSEETARFYLDASMYDVDQALGAYYQSQDSDRGADGMVEDVSDESEGETLSRQGNVSAREPGSNFPLPDNVEPATARAPLSEYEKQARRAPISGVSGTKSKAKKSKPNKKVNTIFDNNDSSSEEDDQDKPNNYYAGGGKSSGQYVQGPPGEGQGRGGPRGMDLGGSADVGGNNNGSDDESDLVKSIFKRAQAEGHAPKHPPGEEPKKTRSAFGGLGFALGDETSDSAPRTVGTSLRETEALEQESSHGTQNIVFWRNGFTVGDGDLRSYEDPANKEFLSALNNGYAPAELTNGRNMTNVSVVVSDKKGEEYVPTKKPMKAFGGVGRTLGSPTPEVLGAGTVGVSATPASSSGATENPVAVDDTQPTTSVQIRLSDGARLVAKLNHTHTVGDLRAYIRAQPGAYAGAFNLMTPFPRVILGDDSVTLADAKLLNAVVVQQRV
ncbi:hypothetical protein SARC_07548 [Sphaeroforma arctica JP610]|uniref:NSFL1 cofactor p47 n=1 Tax=Sphaeroforma arctica JP610 TaxID=667725 RepID=A0A0L0FVY2_9EUKA|nr:hypothetical protein SARC_07548 [Sphaeroforma arctica JP610]KNC80078.1 hypothetical protein SARC_07548 [Sphaeroforma arctica JP610]|eukprot:XP_014153980.1 hypothetical protein SARC_07548 [Sphaeroforma arctica JP610]